MIETVNRLNQLLKSGSQHISKTPEIELGHKSSPEQWSKFFF